MANVERKTPPEAVVETSTTLEKPETQVVETPEKLDALRTETERGITVLARSDKEAIQGRVEQTTSSLDIGKEEGSSLAQRQKGEIDQIEQGALIRLKASKFGETLRAIPTADDLEQVGTGFKTPGGTTEEQLKDEKFLIRLEMAKAGGKAATIEEKTPAEEVETKFDPEAHAQHLREQVKKLVNHPDVDAFFSQLHPDDLQSLKGLLNREVTSSKYGKLAKLMVPAIKAKESLARSDVSHDEKALREFFRQFHEKFYQTINKTLSHAEILGMAELDFDATIERANQITGLGQRKMGRNEIGDFVTHLVGRAIEQVRKEIEAQKKAQQAAEIPENAEAADKEEKPQEWLDQKREAAHAELRKIFTELEKSGGTEAVQKWFIDLWNPALVATGREPLKPEDVQSLFYFETTSISASHIAGQKVIRPVLVFENIKEYRRLHSLLAERETTTAVGMFVPTTFFEEGDLLHKTGLMIAASNREWIGHEIRHSIDPNLGERVGYDRLIDEVFANYQEEILEAQTAVTKPEEKRWQSLVDSVGHESYWNSYSEEAGQKLSKGEFAELAKKVINSVRSIQEKRGHLETQRALVQVKSTEELFKLAR